MPPAASRTVRPPWLPPGKTRQAVPAGRWWDAVAIEGDLGHLVAQLLTEALGDRTGPILCDAGGPADRLYFFVPAGTATAWTEPDTSVLGAACYVVLTGNLTPDPSGLHWLTPPDGRLIRPGLLRQVLAEVREATR